MLIISSCHLMCFQTASSLFILHFCAVSFSAVGNCKCTHCEWQINFSQSWVLDQHPCLAVQLPSVVRAAQLEVLWYQSASFVKTALCYSCRSCLTLYTHTLHIVMNVTGAVWCVETGFLLCGRLLTASQISICLSVRPEPPPVCSCMWADLTEVRNIWLTQDE